MNYEIHIIKYKSKVYLEFLYRLNKSLTISYLLDLNFFA